MEERNSLFPDCCVFEQTFSSADTLGNRVAENTARCSNPQRLASGLTDGVLQSLFLEAMGSTPAPVAGVLPAPAAVDVTSLASF